MVAEFVGSPFAASTVIAQAAGQNPDVARALEQARAARQQALQEAAQAQRDAARAMRDAQREMARAAANGQTITIPPQFPPLPPSAQQMPEGVVVISIAFFLTCAIIAIGLPLARAFARRSDRRSMAVPGADADTQARLERIEQAVDAIAVEVERISEGQRFTTKLLSEFRALPQPDAAAVVADRDRDGVPLVRAREAR
jgi:hypothetical protein